MKPIVQEQSIPLQLLICLSECTSALLVKPSRLPPAPKPPTLSEFKMSTVVLALQFLQKLEVLMRVYGCT